MLSSSSSIVAEPPLTSSALPSERNIPQTKVRYGFDRGTSELYFTCPPPGGGNRCPPAGGGEPGVIDRGGTGRWRFVGGHNHPVQRHTKFRSSGPPPAFPFVPPTTCANADDAARHSNTVTVNRMLPPSEGFTIANLSSEANTTTQIHTPLPQIVHRLDWLTVRDRNERHELSHGTCFFWVAARTSARTLVSICRTSSPGVRRCLTSAAVRGCWFPHPRTPPYRARSRRRPAFRFPRWIQRQARRRKPSLANSRSSCPTDCPKATSLPKLLPKTTSLPKVLSKTRFSNNCLASGRRYHACPAVAAAVPASVAAGRAAGAPTLTMTAVLGLYWPWCFWAQTAERVHGLRGIASAKWRMLDPSSTPSASALKRSPRSRRRSW
jgi:hypothetical protein